MLAQINSIRGVVLTLVLAVLACGCTPAGPRALLKGKKYLDRGDVADAVTQFKRATTLLSTNANAWNYYGVALQRAGQPDEAAGAYQNAIRLDRDLLEAHFNLGVLWLEQNRPDSAKAELTTYTLRRPNDAMGWLKLGFAQLKGGDTMPAERSFSTVLALKMNEAEAYNGLGLASIQLGKPRDAAEFFGAALQARPDYGPALLNLATVSQQYLHDNRAALANYQAYLTLNPRPANYNEVKALVATLSQSDAASTVMAPAVVVKTSAPPAEPRPKPSTAVAVSHPAPTAPSVRTETEPTYASRPAPRQPAETASAPPPAAPTVATRTVATRTVQVPSEPRIVTSPRTNPSPHGGMAVTPAHRAGTNGVGTAQSLETPLSEEQSRSGFWHRIFNGDKSALAKRYHTNETGQVSGTNEELAATKPEPETPAETKAAAYPGIPRYNYSSPAKPAPGDRRAAEGPFTQARLSEQDQNWAEAEESYRQAADTDPSWFEAQYNTGVIAHRLRNYSVALTRYELALAIDPESVDARYNFALALKAAGYPADAADELKKILAANPDEVRAHLALANLYAQSLHDVGEARLHYLRVLELQPNNPQAADIRFWLSANSK